MFCSVILLSHFCQPSLMLTWHDTSPNFAMTSFFCDVNIEIVMSSDKFPIISSHPVWILMDKLNVVIKPNISN